MGALRPIVGSRAEADVAIRPRSRRHSRWRPDRPGPARCGGDNTRTAQVPGARPADSATLAAGTK